MEHHFEFWKYRYLVTTITARLREQCSQDLLQLDFVQSILIKCSLWRKQKWIFILLFESDLDWITIAVGYEFIIINHLIKSRILNIINRDGAQAVPYVTNVFIILVGSVLLTIPWKSLSSSLTKICWTWKLCNIDIKSKVLSSNCFLMIAISTINLFWKQFCCEWWQNKRMNWN